MTEAYNVIETFEFAKTAKKKKKYLLAARLYRLSAVYYENGELGPYEPKVEKYGMSASDKYDSCRSKLSQQEQNMLDTKYISGNNSFSILHWREFAREEWKKLTKRNLKVGMKKVADIIAYRI